MGDMIPVRLRIPAGTIPDWFHHLSHTQRHTALTLYKSITNSSGFGENALLTYANYQTRKKLVKYK